VAVDASAVASASAGASFAADASVSGVCVASVEASVVFSSSGINRVWDKVGLGRYARRLRRVSRAAYRRRHPTSASGRMCDWGPTVGIGKGVSRASPTEDRANGAGCCTRAFSAWRTETSSVLWAGRTSCARPCAGRASGIQPRARLGGAPHCERPVPGQYRGGWLRPGR